jgi:hypothetical protein
VRRSSRSFPLALSTMAMAVALMVPAGASGYGENFGLADRAHVASGSTAAAFPTSSLKAWWAGACDLASDDFAVGSDPGVRYAHCIDHPAGNGIVDDPGRLGPLPPLAEGVTPEPPNPGDPGYRPPGWTLPPSWRLEPLAQAGAHPDVTASMWFTRAPEGDASVPDLPDGDARDLIVHIPAGVAGNPKALAKCQNGLNLQTVPVTCPPESQAGVATVTLAGNLTYTVPVYNVVPRDGKTAEFIISAGVGDGYQSNVPIVAKARTSEDFGVDALAIDIPQGVPVLGQTVTLWGVPWAAEHDAYRVPEGYKGFNDFKPGMAPSGLTGVPDSAGRIQDPQPYDPSWGPIKPFFSNPTECDPQAPVTLLDMRMWQRPFLERLDQAAIADAPVAGCDKVEFDTDLDLQPTSTVADGPSGLDVELDMPQNNDLPFDIGDFPDVDSYVEAATEHFASDAGLARAHLDKAVVTLPAGVAVNPSGAAGLAGCSDAQIGVTDASSNPMLFNDDDPFDGQGGECPAGSVIGTAEVVTPLLDETLSGQVVLGEPKKVDHDSNPATPLRLDPESGQMFRLFIVTRSRERGLVAKIAGSAVADRDTGELTTTFDNNPRLPFEHMTLRLTGGQRGQLALPQRCGNAWAWSSVLTPWTAAHNPADGDPDPDGGSFVTNQRCGFGFAPTVDIGMSNKQGAGTGTFAARFARQDGEQWLRDLSAEMPVGLVAAVGSVPLCTNAQIAAYQQAQAANPVPSARPCPAASRIGSVDASAGSGTPYFLERKGDAYLTQGYKGAPYGLLTAVPVEAGPFRGDLALPTVVVRQALHVNRTTARVTAVSDPLPKIWEGIPLRARSATVTIDRPGFMRNPTDCSPKQAVVRFGSYEGASSTATDGFQATNCAALGFKPKLAMRVTGKRRQMKTNGHPGLRATLTQPTGRANIKATTVRLPRMFVFDRFFETRRGICKFDAYSNPDLSVKDEPACPSNTVVGQVKAVSPLLREPLAGPVYFAENRRLVTGGFRRTFPALLFKLRGEIAINLKANTTTIVGKALITTFPNIPDAPVSRFELTMPGGRNGLLMVTETARGRLDLCTERQIAEVDMDGHNGRLRDFDVRMRLPCKVKKKVVCKTKKQKRTKACKRKAAKRRR